MDSKQNLTPELKEIYDRVMNTPAGAKSATAQPTVTAQPTTAPAPPTTHNGTPPPTASAIPAAPTMTPPTAAIPVPPAPTIAEATPPVDSSEYLSSAQPRPLQDIGTKPFSFSGKVVTATTADAVKPAPNAPASTAAAQPATAPSAPKKGLSTPVVVVLFVAFALVWTFFWLVLLGFIKF